MSFLSGHSLDLAVCHIDWWFSSQEAQPRVQILPFLVTLCVSRGAYMVTRSPTYPRRKPLRPITNHSQHTLYRKAPPLIFSRMSLRSCLGADPSEENVMGEPCDAKCAAGGPLSTEAASSAGRWAIMGPCKRHETRTG